MIWDMAKEDEKPKKYFDPISWEAPEYTYYPKQKEWHWLVGIIATGLVILAVVVMKSFLFGVFIAVAAFTIMLVGTRKPRIVLFEISSRGVAASKKLYPYNNLKSFWIRYDPPRKKELSLESKKTFMPYIIMPLGDTNPNIIREQLIRFLPEKEHEESLIESISHYLGF